MGYVYMAIIIGAGLFGLTRIQKTNDKFARGIVALQVIAIALTYIPRPVILQTGFLLFIGTLVACIIYPFKTEGITPKARNLILLISAPVLIRHLFIYNQWPHVVTIGYLMIIPITAYVYLVKFDYHQRSEEIGFLTINAASAFIGLLLSLNPQPL